jgi:hypothetical protein
MARKLQSVSPWQFIIWYWSCAPGFEGAREIIPTPADWADKMRATK